MIKIGHSFDIHKLIKGEGFILAGVFIKTEYQVVAHSDGDVLIHAITESLLGTLALGSLGERFPENSKNKNRNSMEFLEDAVSLITAKGYHINNIDASIYLEKPKVKDYLLEMRENIARVTKLNISNVSVKPTTFEGLDSIGNSKAVAASSVVVIENEE